MAQPFLLNVCLTGMVPTREQNACVPMTPDEIAQDVADCAALGASMFHVHSRDGAGTPDWREEGYTAILAAIRKRSPDVVICTSTSGRRVEDIASRAACLDARPAPDMASLTLGPINFLRDSSRNSPDDIEQLIAAMDSRGIKPEVEIFDLGMARTVARLVAAGRLRPPVYANILLGNVASADASLLDLAAVLSHLPKEVIWCAAGIGRAQLPSNALGLLFGHGVRVGLEDNLFMDDRKTRASNPLLVERVVKLAALLGRTPYSIAETRALLALPAPRA